MLTRQQGARKRPAAHVSPRWNRASSTPVIDYQGVFNFSSINNSAVRCFSEEISSFLFMNNDIEAIEAGWLENMRDLLGRREVGIVGATLLYPSTASIDSKLDLAETARFAIGKSSVSSHACSITLLRFTAGLPLDQQGNEIRYKRRHGMGFLGLGSALTMLQMKYGDPKSLEFTERVAREMAQVGWETGLELAREKGAAPIMLDTFEVTAQMLDICPTLAGCHCPAQFGTRLSVCCKCPASLCRDGS